MSSPQHDPRIARRMLTAAALAVAVGVVPAQANTPRVANGSNLADPASYSPTGLPTETDDVFLAGTHTLPLNAALVVGSLNTLTGATLNKGTPGFSTITLGGPTSTGNANIEADPADLIYAGGTTFTFGATYNATGPDLIDLSLGRSGRFSTAIGATLNLTSAIATNGHDLTFAGRGQIRVFTPYGPTGDDLAISATGLAGYGGISGTGNVTFATTGLGVVFLNGISTYTGATTINDGATVSLGGSIDNSRAIVNNGRLRLTRRAAYAIAQPISGSGGIEVFGGGYPSVVTLNPASTYTGHTDVQLGMLIATRLADGGQASSIGASSNAASNLVLGLNARSPFNAGLRYTGPAASTDRLFTTALADPSGPQTHAIGTAAMLESSGTGPLSFTNTGAVAFSAPNAPRTVTLGGTNRGANTFSPTIADNGTGVVSLAKYGPGTWRVTGGAAGSAGNTYTGNTTVHEGLLIATKPTAFGNANSRIYVLPGAAVGAEFAVDQAFLDRVRAYAYQNTAGGAVALGLDSSADLDFTASGVSLGAIAGRQVTYSGQATFPNNAYRLGGGGGTLTFASPITGTASVTVGTGFTPPDDTVVLTGNNTYTGQTRVSGGILRLGHAAAAGTGSLVTDTYGTIVPAGPVTQAFVNRFFGTNPAGTLGLTGDNTAALDFATAGALSLGAVGDATFSGTLKPFDGYRLGGGGGTLRFNADLAAAAGLQVDGHGLPSSTVILNGANGTKNTGVVNASLVIGPNGAMPDNGTLTLTGVARLDFGGRSVRVSGLTVNDTRDVNTANIVVTNGQLEFTSKGGIRPRVYEPGVVDLSGLSSFTQGAIGKVETSLDLGFVANGPSGFNSPGPSVIRMPVSTQLTTNTVNLGGSADTDIELGRTTALRVGQLSVGSANLSSKSRVRFADASGASGLLLRGTDGVSPATSLMLQGYAYSSATLDLSAGTTDALVKTVYVNGGYFDYTSFDSAAKLMLGGAGSVFNAGEIVVARTTSTSTVYGVATGAIEQRAGTVLAGQLTLTSAKTAAAEQRYSLVADYVLGTTESPAVLSVGGISIGTGGLNAKSRSTIHFNNGRIEPLDPTRAVGGVMPAGPLGVPTIVTLTGAANGGAAIDSRTLNIVLAATGTHTFAAQANRSLVVDSTALITGPGGPTIEGPGTVTFRGANRYEGVTTVSGGHLVLAPAARGPVLQGAGLNLRSGRVAFEYADNVSPADEIRALLSASAANNFASGRLFSDAADGRRGPGMIDLPAEGKVVVAFTLFGDADLDGGVSIVDFNRLAANFGKAAGRAWLDGDFDYDGGVSITDFNRLAANFGRSLTGPAAAVDYSGLLAFAAAHGDLAAFEAVTGVPEPGVVGVLVGGVLGLRRRRPVRGA